MEEGEIIDLRETAERNIAIEEYKVCTQEAMERLKYQVEFSQAALTNLQLVNGGAIVALLTFIGNGDSRIDPNSVFWSFLWFSFGLGSSLSSYLGAYLSQSHYMNLAFHRAWDAQHRAEGSARQFPSEGFQKNGDRALAVAIGLACSSMLGFVVGAFVAIEGLK